jgi:hypothetical protein
MRLSTEIIKFDDAGATDDHPVDGINMGQIRRWFDKIEKYEAALRNIADSCPATQEVTLAHQMAEEAEEALRG